MKDLTNATTTFRSPDATFNAPATRWLTVVAVGGFFLLLLPGVTGSYGLFIDELYFIACSERPALGYVDHPPLAPLVLRLSRAVLPDPWALRVPVALAGALTVFLTGLVARRLGAGTYGMLLAAAAVLTAPAYHVMFGYFSMNAFEILIWLVGCWILVELLQRDQPRLWPIFGLVAGIGLQNKHTMVLLGTAVGLGLLLTRMRRHLRTPWPWVGLGVAALLVAPNLVWQAANGWPSIEFYRNADLHKNVATPPHLVLAMQAMFMNPGTLPLWLAGAVFFLKDRTAERLRLLGWVFVLLLLAILVAQKSRPDRIAGIYPILFAGGAVWFEHRARGAWAWIRWAIPVWLLVWGAVLAPLGLPLLSPERLGRYVAGLGVVPQIESGAGKSAELPQWFADRFGWREFVADVASVAGRLRPEERDATVIFAPSYGQAGALELYGKAYDLPPVYSTHNSYFLWGPPPEPFRTALVVGDTEEHLRQWFEEVELARVHRCDPCMRWRDEMPIWIARRPRDRQQMDAIWERQKFYE